MRRLLMDGIRLSGRATCVALLCAGVEAQGVVNHTQSPFLNFEGGEAAPLAVSADGSALYVLNQPDHRLEVYGRDVNDPNQLLFDYQGELFTGLEPSAIALHPTDPDTLFVSNWVSDTVSVVDLPTLTVCQTLNAGDEPREMAVANGKLYVAVARVEDPSLEVSVPIGGSQPADGVLRRPYIENAISVFDVTNLMNLSLSLIHI